MTNYVTVRGYNQAVDPAMAPRFLREDEITWILRDFPRIEAADEESGRVIRDNILARFRHELRSYMITPLGIPALRHHIFQSHLNSLIAPGSPVGFVTAMSISSEFTQTTLNTFHFSWRSVSAGDAITRLEILIYTRKSERTDTSAIYLRDPFTTFEDALKLRSTFVGSTIESFIKDRVVVKANQLDDHWWSRDYRLATRDGRVIDAIREARQHNYSVLRLRLDTVEMYKHRVSMTMVGEAIMRENKNLVTLVGTLADGIIDVYIVAGWTFDVKFHQKYTNSSSEFRDLYFQSVAVPSFRDTIVKGIPKITRILPTVIKVMSLVKLERAVGPNQWLWIADANLMKYQGLQLEHLRRLARACGCVTSDVALPTGPVPPGETSTNPTVAQPGLSHHPRQLHVSFVDPTSMFKHPAGTITNVTDERYGDSSATDDSFRVTYQRRDPAQPNLSPDDRAERARIALELSAGGYLTQREEITTTSIVWLVRGPRTALKPMEAINNLITYTRRVFTRQMTMDVTMLVRAGVTRNEDVLRVTARPRPRLLQLAEYVYIAGAGSNLKQVLAHPLVDATRSTCNNVHETSQVLGIEAGRATFIRELNATINASGANIHPIHVQYYGDTVTLLGIPIGATYPGAIKQPRGHFALASVQRSAEVFKKLATIGSYENARNVSASVAVGHRMAIGTGAFQPVYVKLTSTGPAFYYDDGVHTAHHGDLALRERNRILEQRLANENSDTTVITNPAEPQPYYPSIAGQDNLISVENSEEAPHPSSLSGINPTAVPITTTGLLDPTGQPPVNVTGYAIIAAVLARAAGVYPVNTPVDKADPLAVAVGGDKSHVSSTQSAGVSSAQTRVAARAAERSAALAAISAHAKRGPTTTSRPLVGDEPQSVQPLTNPFAAVGAVLAARAEQARLQEEHTTERGAKTSSSSP